MDTASPAPVVSILIVGYNSLAFLPDCFGSIEQAARRHAVEIRFVNNGSDASEDWIACHFADAEVLPTRGNIGFGAANNYLSQAARGDFLLLLNPDTRLEPSAIDHLLEAALANPQFAILGGLAVSPAGVPLASSQLVFPTLGEILRGAIGQGGYEVPDMTSGETCEVDAVSGGFMLINRQSFAQLGGFDARFFLYAEELDLCWRWRKLGGKVALVPAARVMHDVGSGEAASPARLLLSMRGAATFYRKHFAFPLSHICLAAHWLSCALRFVAGTLTGPFSHHGRNLRQAMRDVALKPWTWWAGYPLKGG